MLYAVEMEIDSIEVEMPDSAKRAFAAIQDLVQAVQKLEVPSHFYDLTRFLDYLKPGTHFSDVVPVIEQWIVGESPKNLRAVASFFNSARLTTKAREEARMLARDLPEGYKPLSKLWLAMMKLAKAADDDIMALTK